jgi:SpoVK/Ycf46/Vps4 family AAA+-type ATPase
LGTDPDTLENELLKVFARAKRWNAVCLLDEADVYVHERGRDLNQNAIVGVFLRVLEYQDSVMFLTTNRPDDVDDAIQSRCVARLPYPKPSRADQRRIWRVLADTAQVDLSEPVLTAALRQHHDLTGRDIKNVLKLAHLLRRGAALTLEAITFARQFQPTGVSPKTLRDPSAALLQDLATRPKPPRGDGTLRTRLRGKSLDRSRATR